jgi:ribosomal protein S18 acetylase RimI-like enzyme
MMAEVEARLAAVGCPKLNLQVRSDNTDALGFSAALGYSVDAAVSLGKRLIPDTSP